MKYSELIEYMHKFRVGEISKTEMGIAINIWQRQAGYNDIIKTTIVLSALSVAHHIIDDHHIYKTWRL